MVVEAVQLDLIREHGGRLGVRDEQGLESALARPRQWHASAPATDLAGLAAVYGHGLTTKLTFNDGNRRIAFVTMTVFLGLNGQSIEAPEPEVVTIMLGLSAGEIDEEDLAAWLRSRLRRVTAGEPG
jgi:death-on-curing protein